MEADERCGRKYIKQIEELREHLELEKEAAVQRERDIARQRYFSSSFSTSWSPTLCAPVFDPTFKLSIAFGHKINSIVTRENSKTLVIML